MAFPKNDNWKWQLRDRKGRWIEMGRGVKWYSRELGREVSGTVVGQRGKDAIVSLTSEPNDPKTGKPIQKAVKGSDIEVISNKATLGKPAGEPAAPAAPKATVNKADAPAAKKYNDAGLTADEQKAVDFQEKKAKQAADKGDLDAAERYETAAAKTRKIGEDRIKNGEGDTPAEDTTDAEETPATPAKSVKAPTRNADIERDLGLLEQEAEDIESLSDPEEKASALEAAQYDLVNDAGDDVSMRLVAGEDEGSYDVAVEDSNGKELGRVPMSESAGERIDTAKAVRELANGRTPAKASISDEPAEEPVKAPEAPVAPETPEATPEAPEAAPEATKKQAFTRTLNDARAKKAYEDEIAAKGIESGWKMRGGNIEVTEPVRAIETARKLAVNANQAVDSAKGKTSKVALHATQRELTAVARITAEEHPEEAKKARDGYTVAAEDDAPTKESPETEKPLLNGEEGYVPIDGRGAKTSKETPQASVVTPEDALKAAGVQRTEPVALPGVKFAPTRQQQDIIDSVMAGKNTAVQALAGSGKTSTLEALAKRIQAQYPDKKIAYIAFNRSVKLEAEGRMPSNVESKTQHGLAYGWAPKWMKDRSNDTTSLRRADDVAGFLGIRQTIRPKDGEPMSVKEQALAAMRTVDTFANSAEDVPDASHMPEKVKEMGPEVEAAVLASAAKIWEDLQKPDGKMRFSLDHMRKQWALTKPDLSKSGTGLARAADIIFMDEAQDTPKVMAALMDHQTAQKVVVGDSNQNIYSSFTGSIDYMSQVQKDIELPLTKSWRFGAPVADIGNRFLQLAKSPHRVEGGGESSIVEGMQEPDAILVRSNAGMLGEILGELEKGRTVGVPSGTKKDLQSLVDSAAFLKGQGDAPSRMHDDLAAYRTWDEVVAEAEAGNPTMAKVANMVNTHGIGGLRSILNQVVEKGGDGLAGMTLKRTSNENVSVADGKTFGNNNADYLKQAGFKFGEIPGAEPMKSGKNKGKPRKGWIATGDEETRRAMFKQAQELASGEAVDVTVSTAHKSKGLEWDKVKIGDDFKGPKRDENTGEVTMPSAEELRVAYVAVTRAAKELDPGSLGYVFEYTDENGGIPKPAETGEEDNAKEDERPIPATPDDPEAPSEPVEEADPTDGSQPSDWEDAAPENQPEETAPEPEVAPEAPEEAPTAPEEPEEAPAPEEPSQAPQDVPEDATETPEGTPVANEETVPEEDRQPEPEPEETVPDPEVVPEPQELPKKEAPKPSTAPEPEETTAPAPEEAPTGGTAPPEPDRRPLHPVKVKASNYPDGSIIKDTRTGESLEKTNGQWHIAGYPDTPADPGGLDSPYVYDMPKQADDSFSPFEGIDSVGPGDILITRKGTQVAVVGKRDGKLVVAPHNQSDEWRKSRPSLATILPETVKGVNKFDTPAAPRKGGAPATDRKRTPFSSNRGNSSVTITDVGGNVIAVGDTVRTDMGTGKVVRVRPSDGPSGSAFVEFPDGTIKSFRSNKMRNTAFAEEVAGGDDPSKMEIGTMGEAGDGRAFMVGKGNKPIFKGDVVELADGTTGKISGFAKGVQSVNIRVEGRASDLRKKASVVDVPGYTAPDAAPQGTAPEATPEPSAPEAPAVPEEEPQPAVINDPKESPEDREERISAATSNSKDPAFLSGWWDMVMKDDLEESDVYSMGAEFQEPLERLFGGQMKRDEGGLATARAAGIGAWMASKDPLRSPEEQEKMRDLQVRITQFVQVQQARAEEDSKAAARKSQSGVQRKPDMNTENENQSLKSDRALKPEPALLGDQLDSYSGIGKDAFQGDLFGDDSKLNVLSTAGRKNGQTHVAKNSKGEEFRQGVKVYTKVGRFLGTVYTVGRNLGGGTNVNVRMGQDGPGNGIRTYDIETLRTDGGSPPVWKRDNDLTFSDSESADSMAARMGQAYPGVHFDFGRIRVQRAKEYAETMSKLFNKYPQLSATLVAVDTRIPPPEVGKPVAYANTLNHAGLRSTAVTFNLRYGDNVKGAMRRGNDIKFFNNVPEGKEMEYVMTHEIGHTLDYMTGNITDNETYELMKELLPPDVLGKPEKLGKYLFDNGMISKYSTDPDTNGDKVYTVELVAESFADVELNGANAKPVSKLIHAELMRRLDEISGGRGVLPQTAALETQAV
jgi:hypothetical protein